MQRRGAPVGRFSLLWDEPVECVSLTSDLCRQTNLTLSEPLLLHLNLSLLLFAAAAGAGAIYLYGEKETYCKTFKCLFFFLFCKLLSCHIVIGINLCVSVFCFSTLMFLLILFFSVCTYLYKVYMKLLDRLKGLMTSLSLTSKPKIPLSFFFLFLFPLVLCLLWGSGCRPGVLWRCW